MHGFHSYYPPTASLLFLPLGLLPWPWLAALLYWGSLAALVGSAWFLATAGRGRGHVAGLAAALLVGAVFLKLRVTPVVLRVGQAGEAQRAYLFGVTARGALMDGMRVGENEDLSWDGIWQAEARRTDTGWAAEIAIPWRILRHPADCDRLFSL